MVLKIFLKATKKDYDSNIFLRRISIPRR